MPSRAGMGLGVPQLCSRAGMLPEAGPASRESGMGAALSHRERSSKLPLPGSAAPHWSCHSWENIPLHFSYLPPLCNYCYLGTVWVFPLSKLELLLCQECGQRQYLTSQENAVTSPQTSASAKEDFLLPWLKTA